MFRRRLLLLNSWAPANIPVPYQASGEGTLQVPLCVSAFLLGRRGEFQRRLCCPHIFSWGFGGATKFRARFCRESQDWGRAGDGPQFPGRLHRGGGSADGAGNPESQLSCPVRRPRPELPARRLAVRLTVLSEGTGILRGTEKPPIPSPRHGDLVPGRLCTPGPSLHPVSEAL